METLAVALIVTTTAALLVLREVRKQKRMKTIPAGASAPGCPGCCDGCAAKREGSSSCGYEVLK